MDRIHLIFITATVILIAIPTVGLFRQQNNRSTLALNASTNPTAEPTTIASDSPSPSASSTANPTLKPTPTAAIFHQSNSPTPNPTTNNSNSDWRYPNSTVVSGSGNNITLTSSADPSAITDWYKQKIQSLGMNTRSFVTTNSNNNVLNKLAAAGNSGSINIEIKRNSGESNTTIIVSQ